MQNFNELYKQHYSSVYALTSKLLNNSDDAADIVQEVFIKLHQEITNNNIILYPKTWLYRVSVNKVVNHWNRKKEHVSLEHNDAIQKTSDSYFNDNIDSNTKKAIFDVALNKLKPTEKTIILLYSEGLSYKEIAEIGEVPFNSVGKLISRTLEKLKLILQNKKDELLDE